jgi:hypothetical protein
MTDPTTPLSRAEQAVTEARDELIGFALVALPNESGFAGAERRADALAAAVEARYEARLREAANFPDGDDRARQAGHFFADVVAGWPTGSRVRFGPTEGLDTPADACPVHGPTGSPCDCGHDGGADCHPNPNGATR